MTSPELENLVRIGKLKREPASDEEIVGLLRLAHTAGLAAEKWRVLAKAHERRNLAEYEGHLEHDEQLLSELITTANELRKAVTALPGPMTPGPRL